MITIETDGECGNGKSIRQLGHDTYAFDVEADRDYCYYFCARVTNSGGPTRFSLAVLPDPSHAAAGVSTWPSDKAALVWLQRDGRWLQVPDLNWRGADTMSVGDDGYQMSIGIGEDETIVLSNEAVIPYSSMCDWLRSTAARSNGLAAGREVGLSAEGRPIFDLTLTCPGGETLPGVMVVSGEHSVEFSGEWAARGMVEYLLSTHPEARRLRERYAFHFLTQVNPDGNARGRPQLSAQGLDLYLGYAEASAGQQPDSPECRAVWALAEEVSPALLLDIHGYVGPRRHGVAPYHGAYVPPLSSYGNADAQMAQRRLMDRLRYDTAGLSQHGDFLENGPASLAYAVATRFGAPACLYEPNMGDGVYGNMMTGVRVLRAATAALVEEV
ncbi:MAG: M14 family zinc carboxypeptidase [Anaerolineae bacterium]